MRHSDLKAVNSAEDEQVKCENLQGGKYEDGVLTVQLPAASWNVIRLEKH
jgi:alpha-L-arabinofuranosidase